MIYINRFFFKIFHQIRNIYLNSSIYDRKISKINHKGLVYKPSPYLLSSLIKYQNKKFKIEDFSLNEIWNNKNLSQKDFSELENMMHHRDYKIGDFVFKNRAPGEGMYIIMRGSIKITIGTRSGNENTLAELEKGEFFGELALFDDEPRSANAIALEDCKLLGFFTQDLMILQERNPVLGHKIMFNLGGLLGERLRRTNHMLIKEQSK